MPNVMHIHCTGIGGIGLSGLAQLLHHQGHIVSGSDQQETVMTQKLRDLGIAVSVPQQASNVPENCELLVYSEAVPANNPERKEATQRGIKEMSYFACLGEHTRDLKVIAVAGTHGKTTTTGLIATGFLQSGFDATILLGSTLKELGENNFHAGKNEYCLVEACEYRNNFQYLQPDTVVLPSVDYDHPDAFPTRESYEQAFRDFCRKAQTILLHEDDKTAHRITSDLAAKTIILSSGDLNHPALKKLSLMGEHNRRNAALALKLCTLLDIPEEAFLTGVQGFTGAGRRQEYLGKTPDGVKVYDDYGHHPDEITATLQAFRETFPEQKIGLIFEPHQFSRTRAFQDQFIKALSQADTTGIFPIYEARDTDEDKAAVNIETLIKALQNGRAIVNNDDITAFTQQLEKDDILLFMGAGKIDQVAKEWLRPSASKNCPL